MALVDIVSRVKDLLYSSGVGEKPPLRIAAADAAESVAGPLVTFTLASGEGAEVKAGDILSVRSAASLVTAFVVYVTSMNGDIVTGVNGYVGTDVTGSDSGQLDNAVLEQSAPSSATDFAIIKSIEAVIDGLLYPHVFVLTTSTVTPDLATDQVEVAATIEKIKTAVQVITSKARSIAFNLEKNLHVTVSTTGSLVELDTFDGSAVFLTTEAKFKSSDTMEEDVEACIAMGATALSLGGDTAAANRERASKDSQKRGERDISATMWRDFLTLRQSISERLAEDYEFFEISRG